MKIKIGISATLPSIFEFDTREQKKNGNIIYTIFHTNTKKKQQLVLFIRSDM